MTESSIREIASLCSDEAAAADLLIKIRSHENQVACYSVFAGLWLVEINNIEKIWCRKQSHTFFYSSMYLSLFAFLFIKVPPSRLHAINYMLTNNNNVRLIVIVKLQYIVLGRNIPTQAIIDFVQEFRWACFSLRRWCSLELVCGEMTCEEV